MAWQDFNPKDVKLEIKQEEDVGVVGLVDLVFADRFYSANYQPTMSEQPQLRNLFDLVSHEYTVFLIFGIPEFYINTGLPYLLTNLVEAKQSTKFRKAYLRLYDLVGEINLLTISRRGTLCASMH